MEICSHPFLKNLFCSLDDKNLTYLVLRNHDNLPVSLNGSDLDIMIRKENLIAFKMIVRNICQSLNGEILFSFDDQNLSQMGVLGVYKNKWWACKIDLYINGIDFKSIPIICEKKAFRYGENKQGVWILNAYVADFGAFLKEIFYNDVCKPKYIERMSDSFQSKREEMTKLSIELFDKEFTDDIIRCLDTNNFSKTNLRNLASRGKQLLMQRNKYNKYKKMRHNIRRYMRFIDRRRGKSIAFLGADGVGKSTIISEITPLLSEVYHNAVFYEHLRPNALPKFSRLFSTKKTTASIVSQPHDQKPAGMLSSFIRFNYYVLDYTIGFGIKVYKQMKLRAGLWIFDRYYYDYILDQKRLRVKLPLFIIKFYNRFIPEPDIIFCLGADSGTIQQRKKELSISEIKRQLMALKKFADCHPRAKWIDTSVSVDKSRDAVLHHIIETFSLK